MKDKANMIEDSKSKKNNKRKHSRSSQDKDNNAKQFKRNYYVMARLAIKLRSAAIKNV